MSIFADRRRVSGRATMRFNPKQIDRRYKNLVVRAAMGDDSQQIGFKWRKIAGMKHLRSPKLLLSNP
jgi:hypothetical protein